MYRGVFCLGVIKEDTGSLDNGSFTAGPVEVLGLAGLEFEGLKVLSSGQPRLLINKPPPFKGLNIRIPIIVLIQEVGFINHGSELLCRTNVGHAW